MAPKGDSSKKNTKKPTPKLDYKLVNESTESSNSNEDRVEYPMKKNLTQGKNTLW